MPREPLPEPERLLPAYETLEGAIRRIVRDELRPLHELLEELTLALARRQPDLVDHAPRAGAPDPTGL